MRHKQAGFTLIEIAIVLVIIGLLLGGVLKGQELITQAKIKNVANDLNGITAAVYSYQDRYKRLPGDDPGATRWSIITAPGNGDNIIGGAFNDSGTASESRLFWAEMRLAGFLAGDASSLANAVAQPLNAAGGILGVQTSAFGMTGTVVCASGLPPKIAAAIDAQFDDGNNGTGSVRAEIESASLSLSATPTSSTYPDTASNLYTLCKTL